MSCAEALPVGFSSSQPAGAWESKGPLDINQCLDACSDSSNLFMMLHTADGVTTCSCAPSVDMSILSQDFPTAPGDYQVLDISELKIGAEYTVQYKDGLEVKSTSLANDYYTVTVKMPGKKDILFASKDVNIDFAC